MRYASGGSLKNYIKTPSKWKNKIEILYDIISGLNSIHQKGFMHCDFHSGNILSSPKNYYQKIVITDFGLSCLINQELSSKDGVFGVMPYVAPEVLTGKPYIKESDIYSFGVLMSEVSTGQQPFKNSSHNNDLAIAICNGLRSGFSDNTPKCYIELAYECMNAKPEKRPTANKILKTIVF